MKSSQPYFLTNAGKRRHGFTLLELMIAITITAIVMASLLTAFRTGAQAYDMAITHTDNQQVGRYAVTKLAEDLRNIYYKPENAYNVTRRQREILLEQREQQLLQSGSQARTTEEDENLPELGPAIDLAFYGEDGGETDQISFVRLQGPKIGTCLLYTSPSPRD